MIKNVASPNLEIKKLVYIYLLHHAELEPDLALLSINTIQKSLSDQNPQARAMALRVMSGIRVPVISQIVSLAIKKGMVDMNPYVRKAAALAIPKCYDIDPNTEPQLLEYLSALLGDRQYFVVGPAVTAFLHICPTRLDLIHRHYRALTRKIVDMDEWSQVSTLRLLLYYARRCFPRRRRRIKSEGENDFYDDDHEVEAKEVGKTAMSEIIELDPDLQLLLKACTSLLSSRSSAVIIAAVRCRVYLGTTEGLESSIGPLMSLLRNSKDIQLVALYNILFLCHIQPGHFVRFASHFLIKISDSLEICKLKFEILSSIYPKCEFYAAEMILSELEHFARSNDSSLVKESVRAIGRCAQTSDDSSKRCLTLLLHQVSTQDGQVVAEALNVIRALVQKNPTEHIATVIKLAKNLDSMSNPQARATVIWLVGEHAGLSHDHNIAPDVLRILVKDFAEESEAAKLQILLLAAKVYLHYLLQLDPAENTGTARSASEDVQPDDEEQTAVQSEMTPAEQSQLDPEHPVSLLWEYVLHLTRYDTSYDLRDRARVYQALLGDPSSTQLASLVLLAPKPVPQAPAPFENRENCLMGSSGLIIGSKDTLGYEDLPDWVKEGDEPDPKLRQEPLVESQGTMKTANAAAELDRAVKEKGLTETVVPGKGKSLDDWLNEDDTNEDPADFQGSDGEESSSEYEEVTASESEDGLEDAKQPLVRS